MSQTLGFAEPASRPSSATLFARLKRRRRLIRALRVLVPVAGLLLVGVLAGRIWLASLPVEVAADGMRIESGQMVLDRPVITGSLADGGQYRLVAENARGDVAGSAISFESISAALTPATGDAIDMVTSEGRFDEASQTLAMGTEIVLTGSDGSRATAQGGTLDLSTRAFASEGPVRFEMANGSVLEAQSFSYKASEGLWQFERVSLTLYPDPVQEP